MGYTHYWTFKKIDKKNAQKIEERYQLAIRQCQRVIRHWNSVVKKIDKESSHRLAGYSAHTIVGKYKGVSFNGTQEWGHENFTLPESFPLNGEFNFCKTNRKPYDTVVIACLIVLDHYLKDQIKVSSDGDTSDWTSGIFLVRSALRIKITNPGSVKCA